ncbi:multicomponent Na+:H+ antiporter subunit A [Desulforamulus aeronauticus DSM 10349]|uniref:Multicomponent Na+:H+ antiporter subunit A n=1 Tax=Desulforamulus aeronauticus DSM 10349 TaxID=1121421 RepID=A0A1M6NPM7_9FIRM|nr:multicomponent Na+:H+ antiporter subunit A [Desulforamulus aeronauticus DSM 10349]
MLLLYFTLLVPFLFALLVPLLYRYMPRIHTGWFVLVVPTGIFIYMINLIPIIAKGEKLVNSVPWIPTLGINYSTYVDGLTLLFGLLISGIGALVVLYSIYYMSKQREALHNFYVYLLIFMGAMLGIAFSDNIFILYMFWELTSIASFLLIAYWYQRKQSRYGAQKSLIITVIGGLALLAGLILLSIMTNTFSIREMIEADQMIVKHQLFLPSMLLILLGAFTKSAQFPFHIWLPDAMEAPTPISAYLHSATMVKAGIYLVARFTPVFSGTIEWFWLVTGTGMITLLWGSFSAVKQNDLKAMLAFSTISQLGLIMCLLGIGSASLYASTAILAALFHLINHSTFKGCLFMVVGIVDHETGTRDIRRLGGLMNIMPITFTLMIIGSFSMAGLPPFNGFLSKELFFTGVLEAARLNIFHLETWGILLPILAWIASIFTFIYSMILVLKTFTGKYKPNKYEKKVHEAPLGMLISPIFLASLVILFFFFPNIISNNLLQPAMKAILPGLLEGGGFENNIKIWHGWTTEVFMTLGVAVVGMLLYISFPKWSGIYEYLPEKISFNYIYDRGLVGMEKLAAKITKTYMTGIVRDYLLYIFIFFVVVVGGSMVLLNNFTFNPSGNGPVSAYEVVLILVIIGAAVLVMLTKSRLTAVIGVGVIGFVVAMFFVIFRAPDLALTQLVVETVTVALFLLCFYHLPELGRETGGVGLRAANLIVSLGVGVLVTLLALTAQSNPLVDPISTFFENSYQLAGARNIVNAILVDFRGFDTMLEILVLSIAGLGVYSLIKLPLARRDNK